MKKILKLSLIALMATNISAMAANQSLFSSRLNHQSSIQVGETVDINHATLEQLETLKDVGPKLASAILQYRAVHPFKVVHDLINVPGIGEKMLARLLNDNLNRIVCKP